MPIRAICFSIVLVGPQKLAGESDLRLAPTLPALQNESMGFLESLRGSGCLGILKLGPVHTPGRPPVNGVVCVDPPGKVPQMAMCRQHHLSNVFQICSSKAFRP